MHEKNNLNLKPQLQLESPFPQFFITQSTMSCHCTATTIPTRISKEYRDWSIRLLRARAKLVRRGEKFSGKVWYPSGYVDTTNALPKPLQPQQATIMLVRVRFHSDSFVFTHVDGKETSERVFKPIVGRDIRRVPVWSPRSSRPAKKRKFC